MSVLSDSEIIAAMVDESGDFYVEKIVEMQGLPLGILKPKLIIDPFNTKQLGPVSYDLRLGNTFYFPHDKLQPVVITDPQEVSSFWGSPQQLDNIVIPANSMVLGHTAEYIELSPSIYGQVYARSSIARSGISICRDAGVIDPGYKGKITLEIANHNHSDVIVPVGMRIAQIVFHRVENVAAPYHGKYGTGLHNFNPSDMLLKLYLDQF